MLKENSTILFQGDSVTDVGRTADPAYPFGAGYPLKVKQYLDAFHSAENITVINRGVSGDRVKNLKARWQEDCIALKPDYLSILIGINDTWRRYDSSDPTSCSDFRADYHEIITMALEKTSCEIILLEPFIVPAIADRLTWYEDLFEKIMAVRELSREFNLKYLPLDGLFAANSTQIKPEELAADGVHPTDKGHSLIAKYWLNEML